MNVNTINNITIDDILKVLLLQDVDQIFEEVAYLEKVSVPGNVLLDLNSFTYYSLTTRFFYFVRIVRECFGERFEFEVRRDAL